MSRYSGICTVVIYRVTHLTQYLPWQQLLANCREMSVRTQTTAVTCW